MSIDRQYNKIIYVCDSCEDHLETDAVVLEVAKAFSIEQGWIVKRDGFGGWNNLCPTCKLEDV